jgi:hypothetical protein
VAFLVLVDMSVGEAREEGSGVGVVTKEKSLPADINCCYEFEILSVG